uniref:Tetratricopeptide repeat protein 39B n=1 Tax=Panagrellus redivivus TaxID=6233 RepID=A0A7E4VRV3_PANRE
MATLLTSRLPDVRVFTLLMLTPTTSTTKESVAEARRRFFKDSGFEDESVDDEFEDASEHVKYTESLNLLDTISETCITLNLFMNNHYDAAEERMAVLSDKSMYHALGHSTILFIKSMMTCDRADMERAMECSTNAAKVIDNYRAKYSITESLYRIGGGTSRRVMTDSEIHAELCYAESLLFRAVLTFFYDENLTSFVKGAFKIRSCYQSFK